MWKPGDVIAWRGIYRERIWHTFPVTVIKDTPQEMVLSLVPGTVCMFEENYPKGKKAGKRRWDFTVDDWTLTNFTWHTNRVLFVIEPGKYYSIMHFWNHGTNEFSGYYVNFQQPFTRSHCGIDAIDLDLDLDVGPDLSFRWKDEDDYQKAIEHGLVPAEWMQGIESARSEVVERLENRQYPFDGAWLNWTPDLRRSSPPSLPEKWNEIYRVSRNPVNEKDDLLS
jgi:protein associated with RNAse G/E